MPDVNKNSYTMIFLGGVTIVAALCLSLAATSLKSKQDANKQYDEKKVIMRALGINIEGKTREEVNASYDKSIKMFFVNPNGEEVEVSKEDQVKYKFLDELKSKEPKLHLKGPKKDEKVPEDLRLPVYVLLDDNEKPVAYGFKIVGYGLWSTLYGVASLDAKDLNTVKGIVFYDNGETPGLGKEIEAPAFMDQFAGKKFLNSKGEFESIKVVKGGYDAKSPSAVHKVDSVSGATITCDGVTDMLRKDFQLYASYFAKVRGKK